MSTAADVILRILIGMQYLFLQNHVVSVGVLTMVTQRPLVHISGKITRPWRRGQKMLAKASPSFMSRWGYMASRSLLGCGAQTDQNGKL